MGWPRVAGELWGLACGGDYAVIFRHGELIKRVKMSEATQTLAQEMEHLL